MPGFNQTGPTGEGALTGKQRGMCRRTDRQFSGGIGGRRRGMATRGTVPISGQGRRAGARGEQLTGTADEADSVLAGLKKQYQAAKTQLRQLEEKIAALEGGS